MTCFSFILVEVKELITDASQLFVTLNDIARESRNYTDPRFIKKMTKCPLKLPPIPLTSKREGRARLCAARMADFHVCGGAPWRFRPIKLACNGACERYGERVERSV